MMDRRDRYDSLFQWYAGEHGLDWRAIKAQAIAESNLDTYARSSVGAVGLMQFMPATWAEWWHRIHPNRMLGPRTCAERSIELGCAYMANLTERFDSPVLARAAYNWGMGNLDRHLRANGGQLVRAEIPEETRNYIERIDSKFAELTREHVA